MGCSHSKLDDEEAVKICKDRKHFIKQALQHRTNFASAHIAYIHSLSNVSDALRDYIEEDKPHEFSLDTFVKQASNIELSPPSSKTIQTTVSSELEVNFLTASESRPVQVQEKPPTSPETYPVESFGAESFFFMNINSVNSQDVDNSLNESQNYQWDFFWNPFSSLDYYTSDLDGSKEDQVEVVNTLNCIGTQEQQDVEVSRGETTGHHHVAGVEVTTTSDAKEEETPGFTAYLNRKPTSMREVIKDLDDQYAIICTAAKQVSGLLEASQAHYTTNDLSAMKMLNPVALFRSQGSSISSSSSSRYESISEFSEESCMLSGSHQSTLDRLYAWEKKLYDEVKSGERIRIAYEKKRSALESQDAKGAGSCAVDRTRATIRDLHTQIAVSIHSIESISERIEALRDQELLPQLLELLQGLGGMWKVMAESHQIQKGTLDEAKLLLSTTIKKRQETSSLTEISSRRLALNLVAQLRNWRDCFQEWITSQRSYVLSLTGWLLRCFRCDPDPEKVTLSSYTSPPHRIYRVCIEWSRLLNGMNEKAVVDKLDFFASGMSSIFGGELKEEQSQVRSMEIVEADKVEEEEEKRRKKLVEIAVKVLCHGMCVVVSSLAEFAISSADEHSKLVNDIEQVQDVRLG